MILLSLDCDFLQLQLSDMTARLGPGNKVLVQAGA